MSDSFLLQTSADFVFLFLHKQLQSDFDFQKLFTYETYIVVVATQLQGTHVKFSKGFVFFFF